VDKVISYSPKDIDKGFVEKNANILRCKRGNGYWIWKPYIILQTLENMDDGDYLVYLDSGAFYIKDVRYLIKNMDRDNQYIMAFELPFKERLYTKRDAFVVMGCDDEKYSESNQRMATFIIFRKNAKSLLFVKEWLDYVQMEEVVTDEPNHMGNQNFEGFRDHRHDQSVFSLLSKKHNILAYRDPSQFGRFPRLFYGKLLENIEFQNTYEKSPYPQIIAEHRCSKVDNLIYRDQMLYAYSPKSFIEMYNTYLRQGIVENSKRIAVVTDNMPIKEGCYGQGMCKVVTRLLHSINSYIDTVICTDKMYDNKKADKLFLNKTLVLNDFHTCSGDFASKLWFVIYIAPVMFKLRKRKITKVFIPLGADYHELQRAYIVSRVFHMSVSIYVVDDSIEFETKIKNATDTEMTQKNIIKYLSHVKHIFVISKGMQERITELTGKKSTVLPIPYPYKKISCEIENKNQVMYIGGINELYIGGLQDIASVIDGVNKELNLNIRLRFTYKNNTEVKRIIGSYKCIDSNMIDDEEDLRCEMYSSLFCFMPYSKNEKLNIMQNTSFPSKLVEYLSAAKSIVIYGNNKNSAQRYFEENDLPYIIYGNDKDKLKQILLYHVNNKVDFSDKYISNLKSKHSYEYIRSIILNKI
jgi:hypothetical protein